MKLSKSLEDRLRHTLLRQLQSREKETGEDLSLQKSELEESKKEIAPAQLNPKANIVKGKRELFIMLSELQEKKKVLP